MAFERSSSADTADFTEGIQKYATVCAMNLAKIRGRGALMMIILFLTNSFYSMLQVGLY